LAGLKAWADTVRVAPRRRNVAEVTIRRSVSW
jgi:hypothetical protein